VNAGGKLFGGCHPPFGDFPAPRDWCRQLRLEFLPGFRVQNPLVDACAPNTMKPAPWKDPVSERATKMQGPRSKEDNSPD
jgi:hypothetical protein